jgi:hypothetical protein
MRKESLLEDGDQSPNPWNFTRCGRNRTVGRPGRPAVPASCAALGFHSWRALSSGATSVV